MKLIKIFFNMYKFPEVIIYKFTAKQVFLDEHLFI